MAQGSPTLLLSFSKFLLFFLICLASIKSERHRGRRLCVLLFPSYLPVYLLLSSTFVLRQSTIYFMLLPNITYPNSHLSSFDNNFLDCLSLSLLVFVYSLLNHRCDRFSPCFLHYCAFDSVLFFFPFACASVICQDLATSELNRPNK